VYLAYCCDVRFEYLSAFVRLLSRSVANRCCLYECWFVSAVVMSLSLASQTSKRISGLRGLLSSCEFELKLSWWIVACIVSSEILVLVSLRSAEYVTIVTSMKHGYVDVQHWTFLYTFVKCGSCAWCKIVFLVSNLGLVFWFHSSRLLISLVGLNNLVIENVAKWFLF